MNEIMNWAKAATVRAIKTAAEAAISTIGATAYFSEVDWAVVGSATLLATIMSLLISIKGIPEIADGASVLKIHKDAAER